MFDARDLADLDGRGIPVAEAERQIALLRNPPSPPLLERACTIGDGIVRLPRDEQERLVALAEASRSAARWMRFVPASGAATRMFQDLLLALALAPAEHEAGDEGSDFVAGPLPPATSQALDSFLAGLPRFAFHGALEEVLARHGTPLASLLERRAIRPILAALLEPEGLGYGSLPKGLIPFHDYPGGARTAFEEHLIEGSASGNPPPRFHFTIPIGREIGFAAVLDRLRNRSGSAGARLDVTFSHQEPATDTLAIEPDGSPARDDDGRLLFRPAGHGALLRNLQQFGAERVFMKNIDNIAIQWANEPGRWWSRVLSGLAEELAADADRPLRVCGMVPNTGEPGGGPFWVRGSEGESLQIVEAAQVDSRSPVQRAVFANGTHFNPVFMACVLRDPNGRPFELDRFVDPEAVIVTRKAALGRERVVLERPGLWNGSMAGWRTVFVEVPGEVFTPVKTVLDLLRPEHQPQI